MAFQNCVDLALALCICFHPNFARLLFAMNYSNSNSDGRGGRPEEHDEAYQQAFRTWREDYYRGNPRPQAHRPTFPVTQASTQAPISHIYQSPRVASAGATRVVEESAAFESSLAFPQTQHPNFPIGGAGFTLTPTAAPPSAQPQRTFEPTQGNQLGFTLNTSSANSSRLLSAERTILRTNLRSLS